jgi:hypothetical protein
MSAELSGLVIGGNTYVIKEGRQKRCKQSGEGKGQGTEKQMKEEEEEEQRKRHQERK